jgi:transcriptional regulator with XRE-family HTH domain
MLVEAMPIKDRLKRLRKAAEMTQQALASAAGLSISVVVQIESGKIPDPRVSTLRALAKALGVGLLDLAGENDDEGEAPPAGQDEVEQPKKGKRKGK